jgi:hypothetical protein
LGDEMNKKRSLIFLYAILILSVVLFSFFALFYRTRSTALSIPAILIYYPEGNETFHEGEVMTIKWKIINIPKARPVYIHTLFSDGTETEITGLNGISDTGSYKWIISSPSGESRERIIIEGTLSDNEPIYGESNFFIVKP